MSEEKSFVENLEALINKHSMGGWPWSRAWWKPASRRRCLIKAGALILAEIERIDRAESHQSPEGA